MSRVTTPRAGENDNVIVKYCEQAVQMPCRVILSTVVDDRATDTIQTSCYADVVDAGGRTVKRFTPNLDDEIGEDARAAVIAKALGFTSQIARSFSEARVAARAAKITEGDRPEDSRNTLMDEAMRREENKAWLTSFFFVVIGIIMLLPYNTAALLGVSEIPQSLSQNTLNIISGAGALSLVAGFIRNSLKSAER